MHPHLLLFFSVAILCHSIHIPSNHSDPTDDEISRGWAIMPSAGWGYYIREQKSMRILVVGGSNSAKSPHGDPKYCEMLDEYVKKNISLDSYCLNEGVFAMGPEVYDEMTFTFESWPFHQWPNIVISEYTLNTLPEEQTTARVDLHIFGIRSRFIKRNVTEPSFVLLDLFTVGPIVNPYLEEGLPDTPKSKMNYLSNHISDRGDRGCEAGIYISSIARFYGYAFISTADAMWPSFTRHFITRPIPEMWPYTEDLTHLNIAGHSFLTNKLFIPFLLKQYNMDNYLLDFSHKKYPNLIYGNLDIRMFPYSYYVSKPLVMRWTSWGRFKNMHTIAADTEEWKLQGTMYHEIDKMHICYGSNSLSPGYMYIEVPSICDTVISDSNNQKDNISKDYCKLEMHYVKSWNVSYVGDMKCEVFEVNDQHALGRRIEEVNIRGNWLQDDKPMLHTVPMQIPLVNYIRSGKYALKLSKVDTKFSCVSSVVLWQNNDIPYSGPTFVDIEDLL